LVGDLLPPLLERSGLAAKVEAAAVARPISVSEGTLFVEVTTSPWMMELSMMKGALLRRLNAGKRAGKIEKIVFTMTGGTSR
jgi:predicted nucleic acid-binding Zn ribbon protein